MELQPEQTSICILPAVGINISPRAAQADKSSDGVRTELLSGERTTIRLIAPWKAHLPARRVHRV